MLLSDLSASVTAEHYHSVIAAPWPLNKAHAKFRNPAFPQIMSFGCGAAALHSPMMGVVESARVLAQHWRDAVRPIELRYHLQLS